MSGLEQFRLGDLPPEVLTQILEAMIENAGPVYVHFHHIKTPPIMQTCKQIRDECLERAPIQLHVIAAISQGVQTPTSIDSVSFGLLIPPFLKASIQIPTNNMRITRLDIFPCRLNIQGQPTHTLYRMPMEVALQEIPWDEVKNKKAGMLMKWDSQDYTLVVNFKEKEDKGHHIFVRRAHD
ncbi:Hypothetical protein D9617_54g000040 [Elsinoe fawcettii]|nr:Hypothetical protein D9617_54g000040 [Elsinoe fawcettii]